MRKLLIFVASTTSLITWGQGRNVVDVEIVGQLEQLRISHSYYAPESGVPYSLNTDWDVHSWYTPTSTLVQELNHEQNVDLHFAHRSNWFAPLDSSSLNTGITRSGSPGVYRTNYSFTPPEWNLADQGKSSKFFGMNRPFRRYGTSQQISTRQHPANYYGTNWIRPNNTFELTIHNPRRIDIVVPGLGGVQNDTLIYSDNAHTFFAAVNFTDFPTPLGDSITLHWIFEDDFPPVPFSAIATRCRDYLQGFYHFDYDVDQNILILKDKGQLRSSGNVIIIEWSDDPQTLELRLLQELVRHYYASNLHVNEYDHLLLTEGFAHYHRYDYQSIHYPDSKLFGEYANTFAARFLDVDELEPTYLHRWLYLYMARQGLDQPLNTPALELAPFNREAVMHGKASLWISMLRGYAGDRNFRRGLHKMTNPYMVENRPTGLTPEDVVSSIDYYTNRDLSWALDEIYSTNKIVDYRLKDIDACATMVTAVVENRGEIAVPYPIQGIDESGEAQLLEWHDGYNRTDTILVYLADYQSVTIDPHQELPDLVGQNQRRTPNGLFQSIEPLRLQFYTGLDQPNKTQIYWRPSLKFNAYDGILAGITFYNRTLMPKRWEYKIGPEYSTNTGQLTGLASLRYYRPYSSGWLHALEIGLYGRYFHYDQGLAYQRWSPGVNFHIRKSHPRSTVQHTIKLRGVQVNRELSPSDELLPVEITNSNYWVTNLRYIREEQRILAPSLLEIDLQLGSRFSKAGVSFRQRFMLPNQQWLGIRGFAGAFLHNNQPAGQPFFSFGLSGTQDYLFDYNFIGRSDSTGIWSQQFFVTDGGFKSGTNVYSSTWLTSLSLNVPIWKGIGVFGDVGYSGYQNRMYADYGIRLAIVPDFLEVYFPFQSTLVNHLAQPNYVSQIRFILNINQTDIIQRLRRGWY